MREKNRNAKYIGEKYLSKRTFKTKNINEEF